MFKGENVSFVFSKERVNDETAALMGELLFLGKTTDNNLKFQEAGVNGDLSKLIATTKIKEGIAKDLSENDLELMRGTVGILTSFIMAPIFTDDFGLDHEARQQWEKRVGLRKNNGHGEVSDSAKTYYHANRLGFNRCSAVVGFLLGLEKNISDPELKASCQKLVRAIPPEFLEEDENKNCQYHGLEDAEKVKVVEQLSDVVREAIFFLKA